jgi:hypothetical protein
MRKRILIVVLCMASIPFGVRELRHFCHYHAVERAGKLRAEFVDVLIPCTVAPNAIVHCRVTIKNTGTQSWSRGTQYMALGLFARSMLQDRQPPVLCVVGSTNADRIIVPENPVSNGQVWNVAFQLNAPSKPGRYVIRLQMVQEGVTWFGEEREEAITVE